MRNMRQIMKEYIEAQRRQQQGNTQINPRPTQIEWQNFHHVVGLHRRGRRELDFQNYVINTFQKAFNTWKTTLHDAYKKFATEERLANKPVSIDMEEWKWLINRYGFEQFKTRSLTNQANRSNQ